ncbi:hypothetical protein U1763_20345 [Sphingomonas sp. LB2R24]|uniref:hypothetical protein n=1 Tax=Sphingomonas sorbitolis TaxID=3096165 RepID=UPI002FC8359F
MTPETLRDRLRLAATLDGGPALHSVADAARSCVGAWRSPARARVTLYLHRQFLAAGFEEELVRARVGEVIDALIETGDLTPVRLDGKPSLVLSRPRWIAIAENDFVFLGQDDFETPATRSAGGYVRRGTAPPAHVAPIDFAAFMGRHGYRNHLARRTGGSGDGTLTEFWAMLSETLCHDGLPLDATQLRAVIDPPGTHKGRFGRHNHPTVEGRWRTAAPDGTWCAVRPGRSPNEWHPIVIRVAGDDVRSLDLFDWDEWTWALLARGLAIGAPERAIWRMGMLSFEHPVPAQFQRALKLLGAPGVARWSWTVTESANAAFSRWRAVAL